MCALIFVDFTMRPQSALIRLALEVSFARPPTIPSLYRWKDMYISGAENVYPAEVENVLHQFAAIAEAAVISIPSEQWGEVGMAIIAVKPGHSITEAEIYAHCEASLARFKRPRAIEFVDALPRNATGKIHKPTLRKDFIPAEVINSQAVGS